MKKALGTIFYLCLFSTLLFGQQGEREEKIMIDGNLLTMLITEQGDTLLLANLDELSITAPRSFASDADKMLYKRYRRYANKVYPYAVQAIKIFREVKYYTSDLKRRERKRHIKKLEKELKKEFETPLKKLTKKQGMVLMKMIERELEVPMYELIKDMKGPFKATYWSAFGRFYGHKLRPGYTKGKDPILDVVLEDYDISYRLPKSYKRKVDGNKKKDKN